jgi:hypothetical protein
VDTAKTFSVKLDRERRISFTQRAVYRMGTLASPFQFEDMEKPRKSYSALIAWLWACLAPGDASDFPAPEDVAEHVPVDREVCGRLSATLAEAINAGTVELKNARSSTPGTSPGSS